MKNVLLIALIFVSTFIIAQDNLHYHNYVNDFANVLSDKQESDLNSKISDFEKSTEIQIAVVTVKSLDGRDVEGFTNDLFNNWGIGSSERNDGLMLLVAPNERKWRTEVGYGLEKWLTDGYTKVEAENVLPEHFKQNDYYGGIDPLITTFMDKLGTSSWAERDQLAKEEEAAAAIQAEKDAESRARALSVFLDVLMVLGLILTIGLIIGFSVRRHKRLKREAEELANRLKREAEKLSNRIESIKSDNNDIVKSFKSSLDKLYQLDNNRDNSSLISTYDKMCNIISTNDSTTLNGVMSIRDMLQHQSAHELSLINSYIGQYDRLKEYTRFSINGGCKSDIEKIKIDMESFILYNLDHEYSVPFYRDSVLKYLAVAEQLGSDIDSILNIEHINDLDVLSDEYYDSIQSARDTLSKHRSHLLSYENSKKSIITEVEMIPKFIQQMNKSVNHSDVTSSTKTKAKAAEAALLSYSPDFKMDKVVESYALLESLVNSVNHIKGIALKDVEDVENERRRKKRKKEEEEEDDRRRRNSYSYSSYSSSSSSSSSDSSSFGGFDGGSSGGGGSSGDW